MGNWNDSLGILRPTKFLRNYVTNSIKTESRRILSLGWYPVWISLILVVNHAFFRNMLYQRLDTYWLATTLQIYRRICNNLSVITVFMNNPSETVGRVIVMTGLIIPRNNIFIPFPPILSLCQRKSKVFLPPYAFSSFLRRISPPNPSLPHHHSNH